MDLFDENDRKKIGKFIQDNADRLEYNNDIFKILEGNLKELLEEKMIEDLGEASYSQAKTREAPINVFKKIVSKLTSIYNQPVLRTVENGTAADEKLLRWYEETLSINQKFSRNNRFFNAYLYSLMHITLTNVNPATGLGTPFIRSIPNHQFLVMSTDENDPTSDDVVIICMNDVINDKGNKDKCFYVHTDLQFVIMNDKGEMHEREMYRLNQEGFNPYGTKPFIYSNASDDLSMPMVQWDNKEMSTLIPLLLTDLNYATKFQAFATFVAIDTDDKEIKLSPNAVVFLKSDGNGNTPSFTAIKPTIDIMQTLSLASSQMSLWLVSKGIRPGAVGQLGPDQFASGVSKMIDESDTYESVKEQITIFEKAEARFWDKLLKRIHPFWVAGGRVENTATFSPGATVKTTFSKPKPMQTRKELIDELKAEVEAGFTTVENAVQRLNPDLNEAEVKALVDGAKAELAAKRPPIQVQPEPQKQLPLAN